MHKVTVIKNKKSHQFTVSSDRPLWDELDDHGFQLPHGCLAGSCGACRLYVTKGVENLSAVSAVEKDTVQSIVETFREANGKNPNHPIRLSCRLKVRGECEFAEIED